MCNLPGSGEKIFLHESLTRILHNLHIAERTHMLEDQISNSFFSDGGTRFIKPRPFYYRYAQHTWRLYFGTKIANPGPAVRADLEAARRTYEKLSQDQRDFLQFVIKFDEGWTNVRDVARVAAVKSRGKRTITGIMSAFSESNRLLAVERGLIDDHQQDQD